MADIKQAAKWMQEGKRVRRNHPTWKGKATGFEDVPQAHKKFTTFIECDDKKRIFGDAGVPISLMIDSLLADDWEIAD